MAKLLKPVKRGGVDYCRMSVIVDGKRERLNFGKISGRYASRVLGVLEELEQLKAVGGPISLELDRKLKGFCPRVLTQFKRVGLIAEVDNPKTIKELFDDYCRLKQKTSLARTVRRYRSTLKQLENYFGGDCRIDSITQADLKAFVAEKVEQGKSDATIGSYLKRGAEAFNYAVHSKWIDDSPFRGLQERRDFRIRLSKESREAQEELLTEEVLDRLLSCRKSERSEIEDKEWNALVGLLRFGGLRISEALILRWQDIDFDNDEFTIRGKRKQNRTRVDGKRVKALEKRISPLWPELVSVLEDLRAQSAEDAIYLFNVIGNLGNKPEFDKEDDDGTVLKGGRYSTNMGTRFEKILLRNGIKKWPQPFHALRRYRINELQRIPAFRPIDVTEWTGNSEEVAQRYYSVSTREDRRKAVAMCSGSDPGTAAPPGKSVNDTPVASGVARKSHQNGSDRIGLVRESPKGPETGPFGPIWHDPNCTTVPRRGVEPLSPP